MAVQTETLEGYVLDLACARKYPQDEMLVRAREHSRECSLEGHCVESGYGLVSNDGRLHPLDPSATPLVFTAVSQSTSTAGIKLRAVRHMLEGDLRMGSVELG